MKKECFSIIILSIICYLVSLLGDFVYDDYHFIVDNPYIKNLSQWPSYFKEARSCSKTGHGIWRPLRTLSYALDYQIWKLNPFGYHLTNVILHGLNGVFVLLLIQLIFNKPKVAFITSLLFITHPVQTESVAWISSRGDLLFSLFFILGFILFIKGKLILSIISYGLSLLSKETGLVLPLVLIMYEFLFKKGDLKSKWLRYLLFFSIAGFYLSVRYSVLGIFSQRDFWGGGIYPTILTMSKVFIIYLRLLLLPIDLKLIYDIPISYSIFETKIIFSIISIFSLAVIALFASKRLNSVSFCLGWFFILLLPVLNIVPIMGLISEHFLYLPLIGFCLLLGLGIEALSNLKIGQSSLQKIKVSSKILLIFIIAFYSIITCLRNFDWLDSFTLWSKTLKTAPNNYQAHGGMGEAYLKTGEYEAAVKELKIAIQLEPNYWEGYYNLGLAYGYQGKYEESIKEFKKVVEIQPYYAQAHNNLAVSYLAIEPPNIELAKKHLELAKKLGFPCKANLIEFLKERESKFNQKN